MITIRLLGGAKKALGGKASVQFEKPNATVFELLEFLQNQASERRLLNPGNLIIAVNGVDSAALSGMETVVKSGDTITVVTVVHGGGPALGETHVAIIGIRDVDNADIAGLLGNLRADNRNIHVQAVASDTVFGEEHAIRILAMVLEARKRKVMLANKVETELLLRLGCTNQIAGAIERAGLKQGAPACFIAFGEDHGAVIRFEDSIRGMFAPDDSVILPTRKKKAILAKRIAITARISDDEFLNYLIEGAAILTK